jgi:LacI family transcriptional regulator
MAATTIRDLAKKLNLSITTVSRALDGYSDVSENTRQRVIAAAQEIGYQPSYAARQLRRKRSDAIGYILPTVSPRFSDPFFSLFLSGLCDEAGLRHYDLVTSSCPPDSEEEKALYERWTQTGRVDGVVLNRARIKDWRARFLIDHKIPCVSLGRPNKQSDFPSIVVDEYNGVRRLVNHLASAGRARIAFIGASPTLAIQDERFGGYRKGLEDSSLPFDPTLVVEGDLTEEGGYRATQGLLALARPPTAILGCNDLTAFGVIRAVREAGKTVGKDVAVAGYDGIKESEYTHPPLTTLYQPTYEIARKMAAMLISLINGEELEPNPIIQPELILRESTV